MIYAIFDRIDGRITKIISGTERTAAINCLDGVEDFSLVGLGVMDDTHYIRDGQAVEKSDLSPVVTTNGMEAIVSGLPPGLAVLWDGEEGVTDDAPIELDHDEPGTYTLRILGGAPYLDAELEVTLG